MELTPAAPSFAAALALPRELRAAVTLFTAPSSRRGYDRNSSCASVPGECGKIIVVGNSISVDAKGRFSSLVLPHLPDAYGLARSLTGNRADAEDVVQDACLRAFRALDTVAVTNARAWLLTIVHNTAFTWLAKNRPKAIVAVSDLEAVERTHGCVDRDGETPETTIIAKADGARLAAAIAALPLPYRETLVLRDVQGLDYREIAEVTGVPIGTVMSRLARARGRLATALRKDE
jgi:RNA polymerase sigma-70 factor, ECF subfamily